MQTITREQLVQRLADRTPLALLEALPERFYTAGHLPGALLFPHTQVRELANALLPDRALAIVVYCASASCRNSHTAAALLSALGYRNVAVYVEGKADWTQAGLPLEASDLRAAAAP